MLTIKLACGHTAQRETPRDPGEAAAVVNDWRKRSCPDPECRPYGEEIKIAKNLLDEEHPRGKTPKRIDVHPITNVGHYGGASRSGNIAIYHRHDANGCTLVQNDGDQYSERQHAGALTQQGFAVLTAGDVRQHLRSVLRSGEPTTTTMALASDWLARRHPVRTVGAVAEVEVEQASAGIAPEPEPIAAVMPHVEAVPVAVAMPKTPRPRWDTDEWPPMRRARLAACDELGRLVAVQAATALVQQARVRALALTSMREG